MKYLRFSTINIPVYQILERRVQMPYINSKLTIKLSEEDKEVLKTKMGKIITGIP